MRKHKDAAATPRTVIRLGATYQDRKGAFVIAEEFEFGPLGRTGRVIVCADDERLRFPRRWYCRATDLVEVPEQGDLPLIPTDGGTQP